MVTIRDPRVAIKSASVPMEKTSSSAKRIERNDLPGLERMEETGAREDREGDSPREFTAPVCPRAYPRPFFLIIVYPRRGVFSVIAAGKGNNNPSDSARHRQRCSSPIAKRFIEPLYRYLSRHYLPPDFPRVILIPKYGVPIETLFQFRKFVRKANEKTDKWKLLENVFKFFISFI